MSSVHHRTATIDGHEIFYREAGPPADAPPAIVLLHGYPHQLVHVPRTHPAPGRPLPRHRAGPPRLRPLRRPPLATEFTYTFDALADLTSQLLDRLGLDRYALYVQDYGAPIGWRLALKHPPERISALVTQNGNGYEDGFVDAFWTDVWAYGGANPRSRHRTRRPRRAEPRRHSLAVRARRTGPPSLVSPDTWEHDYALVSRQGNDEIQLALFRDYQNNRPLYPLLHEFLRTSEVPVLAVWGSQRRNLRPPGRRTSLRPRRQGRRSAPDQRRPLPPGKPPARRRGIPPRLPRTGAGTARASASSEGCRVAGEIAEPGSEGRFA